MGPSTYTNNPNLSPYPSGYNNAYPPSPDNGFRKKLLILLLGVLFVTVIIIIISVSTKSNHTITAKVGNKTYVTNSSQQLGTMEISASGISDSDGLSITLNDGALPTTSIVSSGSYSKKLPAGNYSLQVTKTGYKSFSAQFTITSSHTTIVTVNLQPVVNTTISSWSQVQANGDPALWDTPTQEITNPHPNVTIQNVQYFYNQTWAFITTYDESLYGYEVAKFDTSTNTWIGVAATDQFFSNVEVYSMPSELQTYLENNNFTYIGAASGQ